ncbi:MAG: hypothetical protein WBR18_14360 [Anaerolineales bacterium]
MLIQQGPADTFNYMLMGFAVIVGVMAVYIANIALRFRNMRHDLRVLREIVEDQKK